MQKKTSDAASKVLNEIIETLKFEDVDTILQFSADPDYGLLNPYSKVSCLVTYLNSMEFGRPPLYAEANRVAREQDFDYISQLGPYLQALSWITATAERKKQPSDKIQTG